GVTHAMYLLRQVGIYYNRMNHGNFNFEERTLSREIFNCTIGLIGGGHIGGATAQIYSSLGAKVLLFDPYYRSEEHTSELQSRFDLVCRLLLEKKNIQY